MFDGFKFPKKMLVMPLLTKKVQSLLIKLSAKDMQDYDEVRDFVLPEFHLTAEKYREKFYTATKKADETYTLLGSRLKTLFSYYVDSRKVKDKDQVLELLVADRLKQLLPIDCLDHILAAVLV